MTFSSVVDSYTTSLVKGTPTRLSTSRGHLAATTVGTYALFGGGNAGSTKYATVDTYSASLVKGVGIPLSVARTAPAATTLGEYGLFCGGYDSVSTSAVVDTYNASLVRETAPPMSSQRGYVAAVVIGEYALVGGAFTEVDAYKKSEVPSIVIPQKTKYRINGGKDQISASRVNVQLPPGTVLHVKFTTKFPQ